MAQVKTGHKVVAMPAPGAGFPPSNRTSLSSPYHTRIRSRSLSRNSVSRSRDIVQDVYDRMGVNYVKGQPSLENFTFNDSKTIDLAADTQSRGRQTTRHSELGTTNSMLAKNQSEKRIPPKRSFSSGRGVPSWQKSVISDSNSVISNKSLNFEPGLKVEKRSVPHSISSKSLFDARDEDFEKEGIHAPEDERDNVSVLSFRSTRSLKDRISAYGASIRASASPRATVRQGYGNNFRRSYPPKVNIYETKSSNIKEVVKDVDSTAGKSMIDDQSGAMTPNRSKLDAGFLSFRQFGQVPMVEIPNDQQPDLLSIAASSVSGEDFGIGPSPKKRSSKLSVKGFGGGNQASIEKQVEYRVQAQMTVISQRFESELRRIESRLEQECISRIKKLEQENQELSSLVKQMHPGRN